MQISTQFLGLVTYGVQWVLWLLIGLSIASVAVMLERVWHFATYRKDVKALAGDIIELLQSSSARPDPAGRQESKYLEVLAAAAEGAKVRERLALERNLAFLGTLGSNAPFIGLFGTVLGIIKAFHDLAGNQSGGPAVVMAGISEALIATAVGLMVAIPAVVSFNYFNRRVRTTMTQVDWKIELALAQLRASEPAGDEIAPAGQALASVRGTPAALLWTGWRRWLILVLAAAAVLPWVVVWTQRSRTQPAISTNPSVIVPPVASSPDSGHPAERADPLAKTVAAPTEVPATTAASATTQAAPAPSVGAQPPVTAVSTTQAAATAPAATQSAAAAPTATTAPASAPTSAQATTPAASAAGQPAPPAKTNRPLKGKKKRVSVAPGVAGPDKQNQPEASTPKPADAPSSPAAAEVP